MPEENTVKKWNGKEKKTNVMQRFNHFHAHTALNIFQYRAI
jgi:hypothetical protein